MKYSHHILNRTHFWALVKDQNEKHFVLCGVIVKEGSRTKETVHES